MKKSFILYMDSLSIYDRLTPEQIGHLHLAIRQYQMDGTEPTDFMIQIIFEPFLNQFKRDQEKYDKIVERNKNNGSKGGRPRNQDEPKETEKTQSVIPKPKKADSDNDNDSVSVSDNDSVSKKEYIPSDDGKKFADWFNEKMRPDSIKPATKKELLDWAKVYDDLITKDKKTKKEITDATIFGRTDDFWKDNFRSPRKLRKKDSDGAMYVDIFLERIKSKEAAQIKQEQPKRFIDPDKGYDTSKPGPGKEYNPVTGKFYYRADWTGERV